MAQRSVQGAAPHVRGVLTIATPHAGAPIAEASRVSLVGGAIVGAGLYAAALRTMNLLRVRRGGDPHTVGPEWQVAVALWSASAVASVAWWFEARTPSLSELQPGNGFLASLATGSEAGLRRVRVVAQPKAGWLSVRTICDAAGQHGDSCARNTGRTFRRLKFHGVLNGVIAGTLSLAGYGGFSPGFVVQSVRQLGAAAFMWTGDELFKFVMGGGFRRSDGVVPVASQRAWSADREFLLDGGWTPSHNGLLRDAVALSAVDRGLNENLQVPRR